ncbi:mechanosensitive ion channel [Dasania sp. GY-MA-18]|uniref:Small-conductance mechanosensitive channel n=1 Tax=Dasania phycosphaerae TaxID=2950436 RepID=A0A9J6RIK0_9GAMM|nr:MULTISPECIES: mechanosensitive ion channel domain-containing protein [Dasania]MCR8921652.1 mechanosensitive ion channel [Dasania sp. GY-MA-18]MCZ0864080.1 mechanosensitive ion channel [Dasania phycosphaerae]MCZ0867808.1 mechanosensitive ion channel [Dasania phycosphaerae]
MEQNLTKELEQATAIYKMVVEFFVAYSFQILGAIIVLLLGIWLARKVSNWVLGLLEKKQFDVTLSHFIAAGVKVLIIVMVAIIALGKVGISVTPFLALLGAASLGVGLAMQGMLSNYSAGFHIIITRPFVVGDTISVQGVTGQVDEVRLAYTLLVDEDGVRISIPNKHIIGEILHNSQQYTLAELGIGIAYHEDPEQAIKYIEQALNHLDCLQGLKPAQLGIASFGDSSINLGIRIWLPTQQYYQQLYQVNQAIFNALRSNGVDIPFPQREVRLLQDAQQ